MPVPSFSATGGRSCTVTGLSKPTLPSPVSGEEIVVLFWVRGVRFPPPQAGLPALCLGEGAHRH